MQANHKANFRRAIIRAIEKALGLLPLSAVRCLFESSLSVLHRRGPAWITTHQRPKSGLAEYNRPINPIPIGDSRKIGIVLQGPIATAEDFTAESIRYYRRIYPSAIVVLSTWDSESSAEIEKCRTAGAEIVLNVRPAYAGPLNVNLQVCSAHAGLARARALGCHFAAKTRTDFRIFAPGAFSFLIDLLEQFPCRNAGSQNRRLVSTPWNTSRYTPLHLSDLFQFGEIEDICKYWQCPPNNAEAAPANLESTIRNLNIDLFPEIYLCRSFLQRSDAFLEPTIRNWWRILADRFIIVDREMLDMYWPKYFPHKERISDNYDAHLVWNNVRFRDWLRLYSAFDENSPTPEFLLDLPAMSVTPAQLDIGAFSASFERSANG